MIPFVPSVMPFYLMYFPLFWWTGIRSQNDEEAVRITYAAYFQLIVCASIFVAYPVHMPHAFFPDAASAGWGASFWYWFDGPNNCFPSLHAANGLLFLHFNWNRPARLIHSAIALGIVLSTVFVKQHYVIDIVAGGAVYLLSVAVLARVQIGDRLEILVRTSDRPRAQESMAKTAKVRCVADERLPAQR
jgi:membrane-associated phospholipid phosphatase